MNKKTGISNKINNKILLTVLRHVYAIKRIEAKKI